ncbi:hypothetical protein VST63_21120 [Mycolicibacterium sp. 050232]|uniref:hypothetical protein n=1 Tax=Mycolicibacterium sp. 050232 TaxID=3113982 RepID=UPI002E2C58DE|nr:hypothetical protein [Mycolicibacterium sp. 050232]MED5814871.1 hypothetical protein [Mycolicibacterium sp. 050232]
MKTVLGLSVTSHGIAWALVDGDGRSPDVTPLDDDAFDVDFADQLAVRAAAAARSARAIAASSGQDVASIGVTWHGLDAGDVDDQLTELIDRLATAGFDDVRVVAERAGSDGPGEDDAQVRDARAAARAVVTDAVARTPRPVAVRSPQPRRYVAARAVAATAAAIAAGLLTVGSQHVEPVPAPAGDDGDITAAAAPRMVTVAAPQLTERAVTAPPAEEPVPMQVAERAERVPVAEPIVSAHAPPTEPVAPVQRAQPVVMVQNAAPQAVPRVQTAVPAQAPVVLNLPAQQSAEVPAAHLPAAQPHLPAAEVHVAADPSPGPAQASVPGLVSAPAPAPMPTPAPPPDPISGWLLAAMP